MCAKEYFRMSRMIIMSSGATRGIYSRMGSMRRTGEDSGRGI